MRSTALAPKLSTDEPHREIFWLSAEQEAGGTPNRARTHSRADTDAVAQHNKAKRTLRACPRPWFESHAIPLPEEAILELQSWSDSHDRGCNRTDVPPAAAFQAQPSRCQLRACIPCVTHNEHAACGLTSPHKSAGRGRFCARVASELLDARLPSECARAERYFGAHGRLIPVRDRCQRETA